MGTSHSIQAAIFKSHFQTDNRQPTTDQPSPSLVGCRLSVVGFSLCFFHLGIPGAARQNFSTAL
jgi:hypothetical protein